MYEQPIHEKCHTSLKTRLHCGRNDKINQIFPSFGDVVGSAPNCDGNGDGKMGIMATGGVHTVTAGRNERAFTRYIASRSR